MKLYDYWRSSAAYRVRIALNLKGVSYDTVSIDLRTGAQSATDYKSINPQGLVPAVESDGKVITQSTAIMEWLEETRPQPPLMPADPAGRAAVRAMMAVVACDIHPLNNLRVLNSLKAEFGATQAQIDAWIARWITAGFDTLEALIDQHGEGFAFGEGPTLADCCLIPQVYNARRFNVDLAPWPRIMAVDAACARLDEFAAAHPSRQPGAE
ncbi:MULTISPECIES: maleylacetoacetate isomerase [Asticcacaulis]|uniref:maleylacetoacetate isomerase n=1 Tax=Asticcacaulis TaxID=76890 RepID=UPI001AE919AC|nr:MULTISPECIES: maleylacetoacetate isomerase [Asticcacaulis]MBP2161548.1 maleylpyruvate isomerase [Asticcacaulis solisilvae]MDR6802601.1 maleylpyruvate isomerase [Asticcacaulis sp. BE141]